MNKFTSFFLLGYLFFQSWTNAFSIHARLPLHVIFGILSVLFFGLQIYLSKENVDLGALKIEDLCVLLLVISITISSLLNTKSSSLNYVAAYSYVFIASFVILKVAFCTLLDSRKILNWVVYGSIFTALGSITEFIVEFGFRFDLGGYLYRTKQADALYGQIFPRSMAFSTEPGILAFFLETLGLISIGVIASRRWSALHKFLGIAIIVVGWIFAFSAASVAALGIGGLIAFSMKWFRHRQPLKRIVPILIIPVAVLGAVGVSKYASDTILGGIVSKVTLQAEESKSAGNRLQRWEAGIQEIVEHPLMGEGPGTAASEGRVSNNSWYIFLAVEAGIISLVLVVVFIYSKTIRIIKSNIRNKYWFLSASIAGATHLAVISTFFNPFLWTLILIFDIIDTRSKNQKITE